MRLVDSPTELTTSATDALLALECLVIVLLLRDASGARAWRLRLWSWVFGLLGVCSVLGAVAHGIHLTERARDLLWKPLYLCLGILVALFVVGAVADWKGWPLARRTLPWGIGMGVAFFGLTELLSGAFLVFVTYEAVALAGALAVYTWLAFQRPLPGTGTLALAILLNLIAAGLQASPVSLHWGWAFDHNGVFHLVQLVANAVLALGVQAGLRQAPAPSAHC